MRGHDLREEGSGTVVVSGVLALIIFLAVVIYCLMRVLSVAHQTQSAADILALETAAKVSSGSNAAGACPLPTEVERRYGVQLEQCTVAGAEVFIKVSAPIPYSPQRYSAQAWAGPQSLWEGRVGAGRGS